MRKKIKNQFTLIEVAVVLLVLVALAGVVVPLALGYAQRSHGATGSNSIAQLTANINRFEVENFTMPDGWDSLMDDSDGTASIDNTVFTPRVPTTAEVTALADAGITTVHNLDDDNDGVFSTFGDLTGEITIDNTVELAFFGDGQDITDALGASNDATDTYIGLGIGENLTAIGATIASAPYDFPEGAERPEESYRRFVGVFNVSGERARFVGVVVVEDGVANLQDHINEYYEATE
jgi:Tfp pilus assembly protein PilE